jgi:hypothetical protein
VFTARLDAMLRGPARRGVIHFSEPIPVGDPVKGVL